MPGEDNKRAVAEFVERCQNRVELEFIDIFRLRDGRLIEHWTSMDIAALRQQMQPVR